MNGKVDDSSNITQITNEEFLFAENYSHLQNRVEDRLMNYLLAHELFVKINHKPIQDGHGTGKTGNLAVNFSRQGKHKEFSKLTFLHRENGTNTGKILLLKWQQGDGAFLSKHSGVLL